MAETVSYSAEYKAREGVGSWNKGAGFCGDESHVPSYQHPCIYCVNIHCSLDTYANLSDYRRFKSVNTI